MFPYRYRDERDEIIRGSVSDGNPRHGNIMAQAVKQKNNNDISTVLYLVSFFQMK